MNRTFPFLLALALASAACASSPLDVGSDHPVSEKSNLEATTAVTGSVNGLSFSTMTNSLAGLSNVQIGPPDAGPGSLGEALQLQILITNRPDLCSKLTNSPNLQWLDLRLYNGTAPGVYPVRPDITGSQPGAIALVGLLDGRCQEVDGTAYDSTGGSVTLTSIDDSGAAGSFDIQFGSHGSLKGTFHSSCLHVNPTTAPADPACAPQ